MNTSGAETRAALEALAVLSAGDPEHRAQREEVSRIVQATLFDRAERDVFDVYSNQNSLAGTSRGVEFVLDRSSASRLSGSIAYSFGHGRYTNAATGERFWGSRAFSIGAREMTLVVEMLNVLNRANVGPANGSFLPSGEAMGFTERLLPRFATAGLRIHF